MPFIKGGIAFNRKGRVQPFVPVGTPYHPPPNNKGPKGAHSALRGLRWDIKGLSP